jgi:hypothetical protein
MFMRSTSDVRRRLCSRKFNPNAFEELLALGEGQAAIAALG